MLGFDLKKASRLNRFKEEFEDLGEIGSGGFAEVRKVISLIDRREYAAKIIKIKPSFNSDDTNERYFKIIGQPRTNAHLSHPNVLEYHGCWVELESFSEQEKAQMLQQEQQTDLEFQMVVLNQSYSSDGILFGSSSQNEERQESIQQQKCKIEKSKKIGDGSSSTDYKEIKIIMISQLCQYNLQAFLYQRASKRSNRQLQNIQLLQNYRLTLDMIAGLNYLHSKRIIHRDIKLHNLMVSKDGFCKIIDYGLAKKVKYWKTSIQQQQYYKLQANQDQDEKYSSSIGTKLFSSPQQASSQRYDFRTDIYSLGIVIVLLFHPCTTSHQQRDLLEKIRKRNIEQVNIVSPLKHLLTKCLGSQNQRPSLRQLKKCIQDQIKQLLMKDKSLQNILKNRQGLFSLSKNIVPSSSIQNSLSITNKKSLIA